MIASRRALLFLILLGCLALPACRRAHRELAATPDSGPLVGQYKGRMEQPDGRSRQFRLLLFAALPDRIHAEVLSPLGSTQIILDGGDGSLAITFVGEGLSFVGRARPEALARILGVSLPLEDLVRGLLTGRGGSDEITWRRTGDRDPGLPDSLRIETSGSRLELQLRRLRPSGAREGDLGHGRPPGNTEVRPIEELEAEGQRVEELIPEERR